MEELDFKTKIDYLLDRYSDEQIAVMLGVTTRSILNYIKGETRPHPKTAKKLSEIYANEFEPQQTNIIQLRNDEREGVPIYDVPIDASFLERIHDSSYFEPMYFINIPKLRNCNFGAIVSGSSMYPIMKSGSIAMCRLVEDLNYFDPGEMYLLSTTNGFETVKYVQAGESQDELLLIPHNEKIKPTTIKKNMIIRMCIVEAWLNFR